MAKLALSLCEQKRAPINAYLTERASHDPPADRQAGAEPARAEADAERDGRGADAAGVHRVRVRLSMRSERAAVAVPNANAKAAFLLPVGPVCRRQINARHTNGYRTCPPTERQSWRWLISRLFQFSSCCRMMRAEHVRIGCRTISAPPNGRAICTPSDRIPVRACKLRAKGANTAKTQG